MTTIPPTPRVISVTCARCGVAWEPEEDDDLFLQQKQGPVFIGCGNCDADIAVVCPGTCTDPEACDCNPVPYVANERGQEIIRLRQQADEAIATLRRLTREREPWFGSQLRWAWRVLRGQRGDQDPIDPFAGTGRY